MHSAYGDSTDTRRHRVRAALLEHLRRGGCCAGAECGAAETRPLPIPCQAQRHLRQLVHGQSPLSFSNLPRQLGTWPDRQMKPLVWFSTKRTVSTRGFARLFTRPASTCPTLCPARGRFRDRHHHRLPVRHRGRRSPGRPRPHARRSSTGRVDEGVCDPGRDAAADRPDRRRPSLLLGQTQEARHECAGRSRPEGPPPVGITALAGAVHDVRAAREHGIIDALAEADINCWADKGYQGAGSTIRLSCRGRWDTLSVGQQFVNRSHAKGSGTGRTSHRHPQVLAAPPQAPLLDDSDHHPRPGCPHPPSGQLRLKMERLNDSEYRGRRETGNG